LDCRRASSLVAAIGDEGHNDDLFLWIERRDPVDFARVAVGTAWHCGLSFSFRDPREFA